MFVCVPMVDHTLKFVAAGSVLHNLDRAPRVTVILMVRKRNANMASAQRAQFVSICLCALQQGCVPEVRGFPHRRREMPTSVAAKKPNIE